LAITGTTTVMGNSAVPLCRKERSIGGPAEHSSDHTEAIRFSSNIRLVLADG
jgi:hypothetical protein